jgi:hypothetical protein
MAARRSRHRRSRNASTAVMAGYRSNAIAVKPRPASRLNTSADRAIRRSTTQEIAMAAIAKAFSNVILPAISPDFDILKTVAVFCGVGLCVSLILASYGFDVSAGFF